MSSKFTLHKKERRMIYIFSFLTILCTLFHFLMPAIYNAKLLEAPEFEQVNQFLNEEKNAHQLERSYEKKPKESKFQEQAASKNSRKKMVDELKTKRKNSFPPLQVRPFDPNSISKDQLTAMKLAPFLVDRICNYRNKGGSFYKKEDLKKIYGLTDSIYQLLQPYIIIRENDTAFKKKEIAVISFIDVNSATANDFQSLNGIGPVLSSRIVKFRDILGGFHNVGQVSETYGLADSTFQKIKPYLSIGVSPKRININLVELEELKKHPYISYQMAKILLNYRKQHGAFNKIEDLKKIKILSDSEYSRILPYLSV